MSATSLTAFVAATALATVLGLAAAGLVYHARPAQCARFGLCAACLGVLALTAVGVGYAASRPPTPPGSDWYSRCQPGLYDNGGSADNGPVCIPWPQGRHP